MADPAHPHTLGPPITVSSNSVDAVAYSPDGRTLLTGDGDGTIRLWSLPSMLTGPVGPVFSVAFSPDGRTLAAGSQDNLVRLWDTTDPGHPRLLGPPLVSGTGSGYANGGIDSLAFSPDGRTLAVGSQDDKLFIWDVADPAHPRSLGRPLSAGTGTAPSIGVNSVAFSPNDRILATGSHDNLVRLWDVTDPVHPRLLGLPLVGGTGTGLGGGVNSVAFSPDGRILAAGSQSGTIRLWDVANPAHPRPLGSPLPGRVFFIQSVAFSPVGSVLADGGSDGTVQLWNVANPAQPRPLGSPLLGSVGPIVSVAFSPDGSTLAAGGIDAAIQLWHVANPAHAVSLGAPLTGHTGVVESVAFRQGNGLILASGSDDETIRLWNLSVRYAINRICSAGGNNLTTSQWHSYIPQLPYRPVCSQ